VITKMTTTPQPASLSEAIDMAYAGLEFLATAAPTEMSPESLAECLQSLEEGRAIFARLGLTTLAVLAASVATNIRRGVHEMSYSSSRIELEIDKIRLTVEKR